MTTYPTLGAIEAKAKEVGDLMESRRKRHEDVRLRRTVARMVIAAAAGLAITGGVLGSASDAVKDRIDYYRGVANCDFTKTTTIRVPDGLGLSAVTRHFDNSEAQGPIIAEVANANGIKNPSIIPSGTLVRMPHQCGEAKFKP